MRWLATLIVSSLTLPGLGMAGGPVISVDDPIAFSGTFDATITITTDFATSGFSYGLCDPDQVFMVTQVLAGPAFDDAGFDPAFFAPALSPAGGDLGDHTAGCVYDFAGMNTLQAGSRDVVLVNYESLVGPGGCGDESGQHPLEFCNTLGMPLVITTIVDLTGTGFDPTFDDGVVTIQSGPPPFKYIAPSISAAPESSGAVDLFIADLAFLGGIQGFSMGLAVGSDVTLTDVVATGALAATNGGTGPDFIGPNLSPDGGPGFTAGVVVSFAGSDTLVVSESGSAVLALHFDVGFVPDIVNVLLDWTDTLGDPQVENTVVLDGVGQCVLFCNGRIEIGSIPPPTFIRADCNDDGVVNIADGINILNVYVSGTGPVHGSCDAACDANHDGVQDVSDAIYVINWRFLDGPTPPAPFPDCGVEVDALDCNSQSCP